MINTFTSFSLIRLYQWNYFYIICENQISIKVIKWISKFIMSKYNKVFYVIDCWRIRLLFGLAKKCMIDYFFGRNGEMQWTIYHLLYWKILLLEKLKLNTVLVKSGIFLLYFFSNKLFFLLIKNLRFNRKNKIWYCSVYGHIKDKDHKWIKIEKLKTNYDILDQFFLYCLSKSDSGSLFNIF